MPRLKTVLDYFTKCSTPPAPAAAPPTPSTTAPVTAPAQPSLIPDGHIHIASPDEMSAMSSVSSSTGSQDSCDDQESESMCSDTSTATEVAFGVNTYAEFVHKFSHIVYRNVRGAHFNLPDNERIALDAGLEYFKRYADMFLMDTAIIRTANGLSILNIVKPILLLTSGLFLEEHCNNDNVAADAVQPGRGLEHNNESNTKRRHVRNPVEFVIRSDEQAAVMFIEVTQSVMTPNKNGEASGYWQLLSAMTTALEAHANTIVERTDPGSAAPRQFTLHGALTDTSIWVFVKMTLTVVNGAAKKHRINVCQTDPLCLFSFPSPGRIIGCGDSLRVISYLFHILHQGGGRRVDINNFAAEFDRLDEMKRVKVKTFTSGIEATFLPLLMQIKEERTRLEQQQATARNENVQRKKSIETATNEHVQLTKKLKLLQAEVALKQSKD